MPKIRLGPEPPRYRPRIQLIPETSWYYNLRKVLPREEWDNLRRRVYAEYGYCCAGCRTTGKMHAHEVWEWNMKTKVQKLVEVVALCELCHAVEHFGHTEMQGRAFTLKVVRHITKVLDWTHNQFWKQREKAIKTWQQRNVYDWKIDFGPYAKLVKEKGIVTKPRNTTSTHQ